MPTLAQNTAMIRTQLGYPMQDSPTDGQLMQSLVNTLMNHSAALVNTRNHWSVSRWTLQVVAGVEDYLVSATDFGRPFLIYTVDPSNTYHWRTEIPFSLLQDADQRYFGPQQSYSSYPWSAVEMCFYRVGQQWYVRPVPIPGGSAQYEIWYEVNYDYASPSDTTGLEAFHHLVRTQTALSALPFAEWRGVSMIENPKIWEMKAKAIRDSLLHDEIKYQKAFNDYRAQVSRETVNGKRGYGYSYEQAAGGFGTGGMVNGWGA
jgi:hypothetical protein